jgi:hypothetical protein
MSDVLLLGETDGETAVNVREAFIALYGRADGYVTHMAGRSFRCVSCPADCKHRSPYSMTAIHHHAIPVSIEDVGEAPAGHDGLCFECSEAVPPAGWSQLELRAYAAGITTKGHATLRNSGTHTSQGEVGSRALRRATRGK